MRSLRVSSSALKESSMNDCEVPPKLKKKQKMKSLSCDHLVVVKENPSILEVKILDEA